MTSSIVNEIKTTKSTFVETTKKTYVEDYPTIPFLMTLIVFIILNILEKRIRI